MDSVDIDALCFCCGLFKGLCGSSFPFRCDCWGALGKRIRVYVFFHLEKRGAILRAQIQAERNQRAGLLAASLSFSERLGFQLLGGA